MKIENIVIRWYDARESFLNHHKHLDRCNDCTGEYNRATQLLMAAAMELKQSAASKKKSKREKSEAKENG